MSTTLLSLALLGVLAPPVEVSENPETLLFVRSTPAGAKVLLDGKPLGTTDDLFRVEPGVRRIVIELEGHAPKSKEVTIRVGEVTRIVLEMRKQSEVAASGPVVESEGDPGSHEGFARVKESDWGPQRNGVQCFLQAQRRVWQSWETPQFLLRMRSVGNARPGFNAVNLFVDGHRCEMFQRDPAREIAPGQQISIPLDVRQRLSGNPSFGVGLRVVHAMPIRGKGKYGFLNSNSVTVEILPPGAGSVEEVERALNQYEMEGGKILAGFLPCKTSFVQGEPPGVTFLVKNLSDRKYGFGFGGDYRGTGRHDRFKITATDTGLAHVQGLANLRHLMLTETKVTDAGMQHLAGLSKLQFLHLYRTKTGDAGLAHLKGLTQLGGLYLDSSKTTGAGLVHLKGMTSLQDLRLNHTQVDDAGLAHLKGMTTLNNLELSHTRVTDAGLTHLSGLKNLRRLSLGDTKVTDEGVKRLQEALPNTRVSH